MKEINIKSSTIEKGLDLAKEFVGKLISPTVEEVGLLFADKIRYLRLKNQVKILLKAKEIVNKNNINVGHLSLKILVPLLENASLEEEENLQQRWTNLLVNMIDSEQNVQSNILPYILSQISKDEYSGLQEIFKQEQQFKSTIKELLRIREDNLSNDFNEVEKEDKLNNKVRIIEQKGFEIITLQEFEISNLIRLGLIRRLPPKILIDDYNSRLNMNMNIGFLGNSSIEAEYDLNEIGYRITELGEKFLTATKEKSVGNNA